ncbi:penicillin-binding protein 1A [Salicola sp. Rm-C-2C1-2]|uniref:penicillin-binding protein 1A n=1 Tax=Salicola sp. Rm-C-2C1-2 TaxID=3141321 RepID=UPI0032E38B6F
MSRTLRYIRILSRLFIAGGAAAAMVLAAFYLYLQPGLPAVDQLRDVNFQTPLKVYTRDSKLIAEFGEMRRTPRDLADIPRHQVQAFLAAEDSRFYDHHGVDPWGLSRAAWELASTGSIQSGGSTITMQVAKNFFLSRDQTFLRKFNEILLALQIERELSKDEIMQLYLNKIYLGSSAYGIGAAAEVYYGKPVSDLDLSQMAMLAGLPKAPSTANPLANPERALARRDWILSRMTSLGYISDREYRQASSDDVSARYHGPELALNAPYVAEMARQEALRQFGERIYSEGFEIHTSVHSEQQQAATRALRRGLEDYDQRHGYRGPVDQWAPETLNDRDALTQRLEDVPQVNDLVPAAIVDVEDSSATAVTPLHERITIPMRHMRWAREYIDENRTGPKPESPGDVVSVGDLVYVRIPVQNVLGPESDQDTLIAELMQVPRAQGAIVSMSPGNGRIEALSGGYSFSRSSYNRATQAHRQPGSAFKPLIFLAALENGATAATTINDAPIVFEDEDLETSWRPENAGGQFRGPTTLRRGLYQSRNLVAIRLLRQTGIRRTLNYIESLGLDTSRLPDDLSLALGSGAMTPMEMTRAYAMIANGGYEVTPWVIERVVGPQGEILRGKPQIHQCDDCSRDQAVLDAALPDLHEDNGATQPIRPVHTMERVADEEAIYILQSMMRDVIQRGTGRAARSLGRGDLAGKTGTTNNQLDTWFMGFNKGLATGTWVGFDQPQPLGRREFGSVTALPIWKNYMKTALDGMPEKLMDRPAGIVSRRIDPKTGKTASTDNPDARFEIFRVRYAPAPASTSDSGGSDQRRNGEGEQDTPSQQLF